MNENIELLEFMHKNATMGVHTVDELVKQLDGKENKIKKIVDNELKGYKKYVKEIEKLLKKHNYEENNPSFMSKMMSSMGIKKEVDKDNSDAAIAHMLTEGFTMGVVDISSKIKNYEKDVEKDILKLAKEYLKFQQDEIEVLKEYL